jgi:hypothetical protein
VRGELAELQKRIRDEAVLARAMEELIGDTDPSFAYARGGDAVHGTYEGLSLAKSVTVDLRADGLRGIAEPLLRAEEKPVVAPAGSASKTGEGASGVTGPQPAEKLLRRHPRSMLRAPSSRSARSPTRLSPSFPASAERR